MVTAFNQSMKKMHDLTINVNITDTLLYIFQCPIIDVCSLVLIHYNYNKSCATMLSIKSTDRMVMIYLIVNSHEPK